VRGIVSPADSDFTIDYVVRDISKKGAQLKFNSPRSIPKNFELDIPVKGQIYQGKVVWLDGDEISVALETNASLDAAHSTDTEIFV